MKHIVYSVVLATLICTLALEGQAPQAPKPSAEHQKLQMLTGNWTYQGDAPASAFGPAGKVTGTEQTRSILGGFSIQRQVKDKGPAGEREFIELIGYDTTKKTYTYHFVDNLGNSGSGTGTLNGNTFTFQGTTNVAGKSVSDRCTVAVAADRNSVDVKCEGAADGKTWMPSFTGKWTKSGS